MKTIEEKAKAYDNIIEKANKMHNENCEACQMCIEELIPEFKESEDERVRKELLNYLYNVHDDDEERASWIAWLEKQGEHSEKFADYKEAVMDIVCHYVIPDEIDDELRKIGRGEQKTIDKVEPKFKIGDTVTVKPMSWHGKVFKGKPFKIVDIIKDNYVSDDGKTYSISLQDGWELVEQKPVEKSDVYPPTLNEAIDLYYYSYGNGKGGFDKLSLEKFRDIVKTFVEDYSKQKPVDKVKLKFKVGD